MRSGTVDAGAAQAAYPTYPVNPYTKTSVPGPTQLHYMNRLACGFSTSTFKQLTTAGTAYAWFEQQLKPSGIAQGATAEALPGWFPDMNDSPSVKWSKHQSGTKSSYRYATDLANYSVLRRIYSAQQVFENMVAFWSNLFNVPALHNLAFVHRADFDALIRTHALGRFEDLLAATSLHPAMLLYLDNWRSVKGAPNENQGRELLECHTVGRKAEYTEQMVKDSAAILSGFTVDAYGTWNGYYDPARHTTGAVQVLGFSSPNAEADGQALARSYLRYLAQHPATALNIADRLARVFVSDNPSSSLVTAVAQAFRDSGTDIKRTLRTLVTHPDFLASAGKLVRNPNEDFIATCRALDVTAAAPTADTSFALTAAFVPQTTLVHHWPRPDGSPYGNQYWCTPTRMLNSFQMHWNLAAGWYPKKDVTYRTPASWLPQSSIRLDQYVDHLCRLLLGRGSTERLLSAVVAATGYPPSTTVTATHPICTYLSVRVIGGLLDSPEHMRR